MITKKRTIGLVLICLLTVGIASAYGGNPFSALDATFDIVKADLAELWDIVIGLALRLGDRPVEYFSTEDWILAIEANMIALQAQVAELEATPGLGTPDYDSGWTAIAKNTNAIFDIEFDINNTLVYMVGRYDVSGKWKYTQTYYGTDRYAIYSGGSGRVGAQWSAKEGDGTLIVYRANDSVFWEQVRVMIWQLPPP